MIDRLDIAAVEALAEQAHGPWVSIDVPTETVGPDQAAKIRLKNLLGEARAMLASRGVEAKTLDAIHQRGMALLERRDVWTARTQGLSVHLSAEATHVHRLPMSCEPSVIVADSPQVELLRTAAERNRRFAVLALSQDDVRLLRGDASGLIEDDPAILPTRLSDVLAHVDRETQLQSHSGGRVGAGTVTAAFHGQGSNDAADLDRLLRAVDRALIATLDPEMPVLLAGVDRIVAAFRRQSDHPAILPSSIRGNVSHLSAAVLHQRAMSLM